ncbi:hypothetical protein [Empedobacter sedimenti]|uniref:hypothetical protein n=1 Tax=Empedobacter sedimenti TaxID=3042610 RepID=UPI0024A642B8|nr:hypothetical protein [Empedobacter sedimenti]
MRTLFMLTTLFTLTLSSCSSIPSIPQDRTVIGTVVRDCTGTYIRVDNKVDYLVCNAHLLSGKEDGETASIVYESEKECKDLEKQATCMMFHEHKGKIRIKKAL